MPILKDGNIYKYTINKKEYSNEWEAIGGLISLYFKINPQEYKDLKHDVKLIKRTRFNEKAMSKDKVWKWGIVMPQGLMIEIDRAFPGLTDKKGFVQNFINKFPIFAIPEK